MEEVFFSSKNPLAFGAFGACLYSLGPAPLQSSELMAHRRNNPTALSDPIVSIVIPVYNERGTIEDDCLVYRFADRIMLVVNASNIAKDFAHIAKHAGKFGVTLEDVSDQMGLLALQGPLAAKIIRPVSPEAVMEMLSPAKSPIGGMRGMTPAGRGRPPP